MSVPQQPGLPDEVIHTDVLICGAGPAGTSTALFLSQAGIPHILIDKETFPRDKVCGDALSGKVVEVMKKLDPSLVAGLEADPSRYTGSWGVTFVAPNGKALDIPFKSNPTATDHPPGFISRRLDFDYHLTTLLNPEHTRFIQNCQAVSYAEQPEFLAVTARHGERKIEFRAGLVIAADGNHSIFGRKLGHELEAKHHCGGIRAYYNNVKGMHPQNYIELHFLDELLPGYFWIFPLPDGRANIGAGMLTHTLSTRRINLKQAMLKAIKENPNIRDRFAEARPEGEIRGWGLPLGSKKRPLSSNRILLAGDAGSMIDPFTGEGIGNAMVCGMLAARTTGSALEKQRFDAAFLKSYDEAVYNRLWDELKLSHTLQRLSKHRWLFNFVVNKASRNKTLQETISCMFEDIDLRARFRQPSFYFKLLFG